ALQANRSVEHVLMSAYRISREDLARAFEAFYHCTFVDYSDDTPVPGSLLGGLPKEYLRRELWVPLERRDDVIRVIVDDPNNLIKRDMIEHLLKTKSIRYDVALPEDIIRYINRFFPPSGDEPTLTDILGRLAIDQETREEDEGTVTESDSVIMQLVNKIILDAHAKCASDIHIEPNVDKKNVEVRYRIDGDCGLHRTLPNAYRAAVVSRIKIMANLDITVRRLPQDGKIRFRKPGGGEIELRVAPGPTQGGVEDVVMRILARGGETRPLGAVGLSKRNEQTLRAILEKPYGMILVAGPTGSGKTTTLHAALREINKPDRKIWTAEDPVEITQHGLRQVQVNPKIGFGFAAAMRAFLRADPDVIMVGEMRDYETAKTAVEASLTGHLVLSTLHTNSAPETIVRLLDMGIDPFHFADALLGILAQRLVRTLCVKCREPYHPDRQEFEELAGDCGEAPFRKLNLRYDDNFRLHRPKGCAACEGTGYRGRMGIQELIVATDPIKRLIQQRQTVEAIRDRAMEEGMTTLMQDGIGKAIEGLTDFRQVRRVCIK
ncbi:MAG: GspE/PulE family protein, partial [Thermodesulfobacteriota bacterium]